MKIDRFLVILVLIVWLTSCNNEHMVNSNGGYFDVILETSIIKTCTKKEVLLRNADMFIYQNKQNLAIRTLNLYLKLDSTNAIVYNSLGDLCYKKQDYRKATEYFIRSYALDSVNFVVNSNLSLCYYQLNIPDSVIYFGENALLLDSSEVISYELLSAVYSIIDKPEVSLYYAAQGLKLDIMNDYLHFLKGMCFLQQNNFIEAIKSFDTAILLNSFNPSYFEKRGISFLKLKYVGKALEDFNKVYELGGEVHGEEISLLDSINGN